jgi:hypothetical protein
LQTEVENLHSQLLSLQNSWRGSASDSFQNLALRWRTTASAVENQLGEIGQALSLGSQPIQRDRTLEHPLVSWLTKQQLTPLKTNPRFCGNRGFTLVELEVHATCRSSSWGSWLWLVGNNCLGGQEQTSD